MADLSVPSLVPRSVDCIWFNVDKPCDDHEDVSKLEEEHQSWLEQLADKDNSSLPIGKTTSAGVEDDEPEDEEGDVDDASESDADELDTDMIDERDSVDDAEVETNAISTAVSSPQWVLR